MGFFVSPIISNIKNLWHLLSLRSSKRKKSDKTKTEQGKYSSKYALTEIMVCDECGSAYRRVIWKVNGKNVPFGAV